MAETTMRSGTPIHLWVVGVASMVWNAFGAFDFIMTNLRDPGYLEHIPVEMMDYIDTMPFWVIGSWALGVWSALLGSMLLLARSRFAVTAFAASIVGLAASTLHQKTADLPEVAFPDGMAEMSVAIWAVAIMLLAYSLRMRRRGVLA